MLSSFLLLQGYFFGDTKFSIHIVADVQHLRAVIAGTAPFWTIPDQIKDDLC